MASYCRLSHQPVTRVEAGATACSYEQSPLPKRGGLPVPDALALRQRIHIGAVAAPRGADYEQEQDHAHGSTKHAANDTPAAQMNSTSTTPCQAGRYGACCLVRWYLTSLRRWRNVNLPSVRLRLRLVSSMSIA